MAGAAEVGQAGCCVDSIAPEAVEELEGAQDDPHGRYEVQAGPEAQGVRQRSLWAAAHGSEVLFRVLARLCSSSAAR